MIEPLEPRSMLAADIEVIPGDEDAQSPSLEPAIIIARVPVQKPIPRK